VKSAASTEAAAARREQKADGRAKKTQRGPEPAKTGLGYKEQRELAELPAKIDALEKEQAQITASLANVALYRDQPEQVKQLNQRFAALEAELASALSRWEELEKKQ
jgi:ATP-binding cassette subfamily F protein uup